MERYNKTIWMNKVTPINETFLNKIEDQLEALTDEANLLAENNENIINAINSLETKVTSNENLISLVSESIEENSNDIDSLKQEKVNTSDLPYINVVNYGCEGDGITDNADIIRSIDNNILYFPKGTYIINGYVPTNKCKGDGAKLIIDEYEINLEDTPLYVNSKWQSYIRMNNTTLGLDAGKKLTENSYGNIAIGHNSLRDNSSTVRNTAIGNNSQMELKEGYANTSIGVDTLHHSYYSDRNTMIGSTCGKHIGNKEVSGRHEYFKDGGNTSNLDNYWENWREYAGSIESPNFIAASSADTTSNVGIGRNALGFAITPKRSVGIGYNALEGGLNSDNVVAIGECSLQYGIKSTDSVFIGGRAGRFCMDNSQDVFIGKAAGHETVHSEKNVAIGYQAMAGLLADKEDCPRLNVAIGRITMANASGNYEANVAVGAGALLYNQGNSNTAIGTNSLCRNITGENNTAIGRDSLITNQDLTEFTSFSNCTGVGYQARVSGDNQVQLGNSATTTYVYGTVQNRSDRRDKSDIRDTVLGLNFINKLRPVDFKWDFREDYFDEVITTDKEGREVVSRIEKEKDGSKKRNRYHHGFIAQEVQEVVDELEIDFGGIQNHSINGGSDIYSLGYDEFIPITVKAIQELYEIINCQNEKIKKLEVMSK